MGILEALEDEAEDPDDDVALPMERPQRGVGGGQAWGSGEHPGGHAVIRRDVGMASATEAPETTMWPLTGGAVIVAEPLPGPPAAANSGGSKQPTAAGGAVIRGGGSK